MLYRCLETRAPIIGKRFFYRTVKGKLANTIHSVFPLHENGILAGAVFIVKNYNLLDKVMFCVVTLTTPRPPEKANGTRYQFTDLVGADKNFLHALSMARLAADSDSPVMLFGETGAGKELVARAVHDLGRRKNGPYVKINCAALNESLIESELFGHEKGAFTGADQTRTGLAEKAFGGTLFLDEIGELPIELQPKLLQVIQDGEFERLGSSGTIKVDVRVIAATNRNLEAEVREGRFREDLWYRLNIFPITVPPLRERMEDIAPLVDFFVNKISKRLGQSIESIPTSVMKTLQHYQWPGNVRELQNVLERAVINSSGPKLRLVDELKKPYKNLTTPHKKLEEVERDYIVRVLEQTNWKVSGPNGAAEILGLNRSTLRARIRKLGIRQP